MHTFHSATFRPAAEARFGASAAPDRGVLAEFGPSRGKSRWRAWKNTGCRHGASSSTSLCRRHQGAWSPAEVTRLEDGESVDEMKVVSRAPRKRASLL